MIPGRVSLSGVDYDSLIQVHPFAFIGSCDDYERPRRFPWSVYLNRMGVCRLSVRHGQALESFVPL